MSVWVADRTEIRYQGASLNFFATLHFFAQKDIFGVFLLALLTFAFFIDHLVFGKVIYEGDALLIGYAVQFYATSTLKQGIFPFWNPYYYYGYPFFAESQAGVLYPGHILFYVFPLSFFRYLFHLNIAFHFFWAGMGVYIWAKRRTGNPFASLFSALTFEFSGFMVGHLVHPNVIETSAWAPWILWLWDEWSISGKARYFLGLVLSLSCAILAGHYTTFLFFLLGFFAYSLVFSLHFALSRKERRIFFRGIAGFFACLIWAHMISAVQIIPQIELGLQTSRATTLPVFSSWYGWREFLRVFIPYPRGQIWYEQAYFMGFPGAWLLFTGFAPARIFSWKNPKISFLLLVLLGMFFVLLTQGYMSPVSRFILSLPGIAQMRNPARLYLLVHLFFSLALGHTVAEIIAHFTRKRGGKVFVVLLFLLQILSLFLWHFRFGDVVEKRVVEEIPPTVEFLKKNAQGYRVFSLRPVPEHPRRYEYFLLEVNGKKIPSEILAPYFAHRFGIEYAPETIQLLITRRSTNFIYRLINRQNANLFQLAGVRYIVLPPGNVSYRNLAERMQWQKVHSVGYADIYENPRVLPKFFLVRQVEVIRPEWKVRRWYAGEKLIEERKEWDFSRIAQRLMSPDFNPAKTAIVEEEIPL
ncbi:MAG: hypothetical protein ACK4G3_05255, partial [bacterium]